MMNKMKSLWALLPVAVAMIVASCSSEDAAEPASGNNSGTKTIPVTITVGMDNATRATVGSDNSTLYFHTADKLAVLSGGSCIALLNNTSIAEGSSSATFQGNMTVSSDVSSYGEVTVVLIGNENIGVQTTTNYSWANNGPAICVGNGSSSALNEAVKKYSYLTGTGTFNPAGENNYTLTQHTAFLNVAVTFKDGTAANENLSVTVTNNSSTIGTGTVTTETDATSNDVVAKFVVPVAASTTMNGATITLGSKDPITLSSTATLEGKSYKIEKWIATAPADVEAVDLGLSVKWASMNVGASVATDYGDFFAWGETTGYPNDASDGRIFDRDSYTTKFGIFNFTILPDYGFTKYNKTNGPTTLEAADDAATVNWGNGWRMPTDVESAELMVTQYNTTDYEWTWCDGVDVKYEGSSVAGWKIESKKSGTTGNHIFLPAAGVRFNSTTVYYQGSYGWYWTSSLGTNYSNGGTCMDAIHMEFHSAAFRLYYESRFSGLSVRPVHD